MERREFTRVGHRAQVFLDIDGQRIEGYSGDLSMAGATVLCAAPPAPDSTCLCTVVLGDGETKIRAEATVVRGVEGGVALHFEHLLGPESFEHLRAIVHYNAEDLEQVELEDANHVGLRRRGSAPL